MKIIEKTRNRILCQMYVVEFRAVYEIITKIPAWPDKS